MQQHSKMTTPSHKKTEAIIPEEIATKVIGQAGVNVVLVGGQALAFWAHHYDIKPPKDCVYFTRDVDFLAASAADAFEVKRFANILGGYAIYPSKHALTALIGQAVKEISNNEYFNIDILHKVLTGTEGVRKRSVLLSLNGKNFRAMHPLDVLASRLINLHKLPEKQNPLGVTQLRVAIEVAHAFLKDQATLGTNMRPFMHAIISLIKSDAAKKVAQRWGIYVGDALLPLACDLNDIFIELHLPTLLQSMSPEYRLVFQKAVNQ